MDVNLTHNLMKFAEVNELIAYLKEQKAEVKHVDVIKDGGRGCRCIDYSVIGVLFVFIESFTSLPA